MSNEHCSFIHSFIHSTFIAPLQVHYYSKSLPHTARSFTPKRHNRATASEGLARNAQGPYVAAIAGFEPATLLTKGY